jgi:Tfp pilus assembly protein FimT
MSRKLKEFYASQAGVSAVEIVMVVAIMMILSSIAIPYMWNYKKLYKSEDQSLRMMDLMREAAQTALVKRRTIRYEIDLTDNSILLIDESQNAPKGQQFKKIPLELTRDIRVDTIPTGVAKPNPPNYADAAFATDNVGHMLGATTVTGHNVWVCRFKSDGTVVNSAGVPISANIYIWPPQSVGSLTPRTTGEIRAITLFGGTGAVRYWKYTGATFTPYQ